jgi:hypothetical protein
MRGSPEPYLTIVRSLQAENPFVPVRIVHETNVLDLEVQLSRFPRFRPRQVRLIELLPQFGDFNRIGRRKENPEGHRLTHHHAISFSRTVRRRFGPRHVRIAGRGAHLIFKQGGNARFPIQSKPNEDLKENHPASS